MNNEIRIKAKIVNESSSIKAGIQETSDDTIAGNITGTPTATTQTKGIIRIATDEEALEGTSHNSAITPHTLKIVKNENNSILTAQINALQESEDNEMSDIVALLEQRTENFINLIDE